MLYIRHPILRVEIQWANRISLVLRQFYNFACKTIKPMDVCTQFATIFDVLLFTDRKSNEIYLMYKFKTEKNATKLTNEAYYMEGCFFVFARLHEFECTCKCEMALQTNLCPFNRVLIGILFFV